MSENNQPFNQPVIESADDSVLRYHVRLATTAPQTDTVTNTAKALRDEIIPVVQHSDVLSDLARHATVLPVRRTFIATSADTFMYGGYEWRVTFTLYKYRGPWGFDVQQAACDFVNEVMHHLNVQLTPGSTTPSAA